MTNLTRQLIETVEPAKQVKAMLQSLRFWSWGRFLEKAGDNACLVAEHDFIEIMKQEIKGLKIPYVPREDAVETISEHGYKRIIVLVKNQEAKLVRELRTRFPDADVYSTLYNIIPSNETIPFSFPNLDVEVKEKDLIETLKNITLVISSPASDCEYFIDTLTENGFGKAPHVFNKPFMHTIEYAENFQISRFLKSIQLHRECDEHMFIHLQSDVLNQMLFRSNFSYKQLKKYIRKAGIKVIYLYRRDKLAQTTVQALMTNRYMRSIWHMPAPQKPNFCKKRTVSKEIAWRSMLETMDSENRLEAFFNNVADIKMITLEEFRDEPLRVIQGVTRFLEMPVPETINIGDYSKPYTEITNLGERITEFKRTMIDRMGLHVNLEGSLTTDTESYLKTRQKPEETEKTEKTKLFKNPFARKQ